MFVGCLQSICLHAITCQAPASGQGTPAVATATKIPHSVLETQICVFVILLVENLTTVALILMKYAQEKVHTVAVGLSTCGHTPTID